MFRWIVIGLISICFILPAGAQEYHWPMDAPPALTSTFGEYRGGRLHAAIDLKTWGKEGYPVTAIAEGYVWRVRTSPWGYGRAVYVKLNDGRFAIWAHLSGFSKSIERYVYEEQDRRGTYSVNMFFKPDQLPVSPGDIIGFSGSTGIGVPHLHFELRDEKHRPINPLTHGLTIEDTLPPTLQAIGLAPLNAHSYVNGKHDPASFSLAWREKAQHFAHTDTVIIAGTIGVGLKVYDRADSSMLTNKLAPHQMQLLVDGQEVFNKTLSYFGNYYGNMENHGELAFDFFMSQRGLGRFHSLYLKTGNRLPFYNTHNAGAGVLCAGVKAKKNGHALAPGIHKLQVIATDVKGNRAEGVLYVQVVQIPEIEQLQVIWTEQAAQVSAHVNGARRVLFENSTDGGKTWQTVEDWREVPGRDLRRTVPYEEGSIIKMRIQGAHEQEACQTFANHKKAQTPVLHCTPQYFPSFAVVHIQAEDVLPHPPIVSAKFPKSEAVPVSIRQTDLRTYEAIIVFDEQTSGEVIVQIQASNEMQTVILTQQCITRKDGGEIQSANGVFRARFEKEGVYETLFGRALIDSTLTDGRMVGTAVQIMPEDVAFQRAELAFLYPPDHAEPDKLGIYEWNETKGWVFVDMGRDSTLGAITGEVKNFGRFALLIDNVPPDITGVVPQNGAVLEDRQPKIVATIRDSSSGIWREEDITMRIDGTPLIVEYDPEEDLIFARPRIPLAPGEHHLEIEVRDICGNDAQYTSTFTIR